MSAIGNWLEIEELQTKDVHLWVCFFCNNQFRLMQDNADDLETVFANRLISCGKMIALLDDWRNPIYVKRIWCVFEQFTAHSLEIPVTMILPRNKEPDLLTDMQTMRSSLMAIDVESAQATVKEDEIKVKRQIMHTSSFDEVNDAVKGAMSRWCLSLTERFFESDTEEHHTEGWAALRTKTVWGSPTETEPRPSLLDAISLLKKKGLVRSRSEPVPAAGGAAHSDQVILSPLHSSSARPPTAPTATMSPCSDEGNHEGLFSGAVALEDEQSEVGLVCI